MSIAAILIIGIFILYNKISVSLRAKQDVGNVILIKNKIQSFYASKNNYKGFYLQSGTGINIKSGVPVSLMDLKSPIRINAFPTTVTNSASNSGFEIWLSGISPEECVKIISSLPYSDFLMMSINNVTIYNRDSFFGSLKDFDITKAVFECNVYKKYKNEIILNSD